MKKLISIILCFVVVAGVFTACSGKKDDKPTEVTQITTDPAKIKENEAIELIKSYSAEELDLTDEQYENCSFMVSGAGVKIDRHYYIKVIATIKNKHENDDGKITYTFDHQGEYFIRYDGKEILKKNMTSEKEDYSKLELK